MISVAYYAQLDCELLDYIADMQMIAADDIPTEEEMDEIYADYIETHPQIAEDWVMPW